MPSSTYLRLLRRSDLQVIKAGVMIKAVQLFQQALNRMVGCSGWEYSRSGLTIAAQELHGSLFQFDLGVGDYALREAVTNSRWMSLAAVDGDPSGAGPEQLAGFVLSVLGTVSEFEEVDYAAAPGDAVTDASSSNSSSGGTSLGLRYLNLHPDDRIINVWLLASLPQYRRKGIGSQLLSQVIKSARNAKAKAVFLHVVDDNSPALTFYHKLGFKVMARIPNFYEISNSPAQDAQALEAENRDALLLSLAVDECMVGSIQEASMSTTYTSTSSIHSSSNIDGDSKYSSSRTNDAVTGQSVAAVDNAPSREQQLQGQKQGQEQQQQQQQQGGTTVLDVLSSMLGGLFGMQPRDKGNQQRERGGQAVTVNGEQMVMVEGQDGEVHMLSPTETSSTDAATTNAAIAQVQNTGTMTIGSSTTEGESGTSTGEHVQNSEQLQSGEQVHVAHHSRDVRAHAVHASKDVHCCGHQCSNPSGCRTARCTWQWHAGRNAQLRCRHVACVKTQDTRMAARPVRCQASGVSGSRCRTAHHSRSIPSVRVLGQLGRTAATCGMLR